MINLFATDMDHTLLDDNSQLPANFQETLDLLSINNIPLVLASGRSLYSMKKKVEAINYDFTFISDNGAIIEHKGEIVHISKIAIEDMKFIQDVLLQCENTSIAITGTKKAYAIVANEEHAQYLYEYYPVYDVVSSVDEIDDDVVKITTLTLSGNSEVFANVIDPQINTNSKFFAVKSGKVWVDIMNKGCDKGNALKFVVDKLHINPSSIATFGDYHNDIGMLKMTPYSHAVSNAHNDVKSVAQIIIGSNNEPSVTNTIQKYLYENKK